MQSLPFHVVDVTSLLAKVNETVLTDAQGSGLIGSPSDISPPYPSQKAISLTTGKLKGVNTFRGSAATVSNVCQC